MKNEERFLRKIFSLERCLPCYILLIDPPNLIVWLSLLFKILGDMCIVILCFPACDVINFEIDLTFLTKPFFYMGEKSR